MGAEKSDEVSISLRKVLNIHGYGFHYAVMRRAEDLLNSHLSGWVFDGVEFLVIAGGQTTHVDFILRSRGRRTLVVAECKRADPAKARWCFARAPYTWRNASPEEVVFDFLQLGPQKSLIRKPHYAYTKRGKYHLAFELKTREKGDGSGQGSSAINQAVSQVLRGTSGLINHLCDAVRDSDWASVGRAMEINQAMIFIPAIFTTAQLFISDTDLGAADLLTGNLADNAVNAEETDWIWFTHNRSPGLKPDANLEPESRVTNEFSIDLRREFARSVAVIGPKGIDSFLRANTDEWLW